MDLTTRTHIRTHTHTHTHTFNGPLSGTTRVGRYQKGKTNLDFTEARDSEWQWHQLGHMQVCTSLLPPNQQCQSTEGWTLLAAEIRTLGAFSRSAWDSCLEYDGTTKSKMMEVLQRSGQTSLSHLLSRGHTFAFSTWLDLTTHRQTWLFRSTSTYHSTDLLIASGVAHLVAHGTDSTSYETISPIRLDTTGGVLSTMDMVVQRCDGPRQLCDHDDDVILTNCFI